MNGAETVILSEVTQTQKTNLFFSHFGWHPLIFKCVWLVGDFERVIWLLRMPRRGQEQNQGHR